MKLIYTNSLRLFGTKLPLISGYCYSRSTAMAFYDAQNYKVVIIECGWYGIPGMLTLFCFLKPLFQGAKALTVLIHNS